MKPVILLILTIFSLQLYSQTTINRSFFVNVAAEPRGDGSTKETALKNLYQLQTKINLLDTANLYNIYVQIKGDGYSEYTNNSSDSTLFHIPSGLKIKYLSISNYVGENEKAILNASGKFIGIDANVWRPNISIDSVSIKGIIVKNALMNGIKVKGLSGKEIKNAEITDCEIISSDPYRNIKAASLLVQLSSNVSIKNISITSEVNRLVENDGMYLSDINGLFVEYSYISIRNDSLDTIHHVDAMQLVNCNDILIQNNSIYNKSFTPTFDHRAGIIMSGNNGFTKIFNNLIYSRKGNNLINLEYNNHTRIINNTLIGYSQQHLVNIKVFNSNYDSLRINNNIFYKQNAEVPANLVSIKIDKNSTSVPSSIFMNNCFRNLNDTSRIEYSNTTVEYHEKSINSNAFNPEFTNFTTLDFQLKSLSPLKNLGIYEDEVRTDNKKNIRPHWQKDAFDIGAFELSDAQIKIGVIGQDNPSFITHSIDAYGSTWANNNFVVDDNSVYKSSSYVTYGNNDNIPLKYWKGFTYNWVRQGDADSNKPCGIGVYKISNSHDPSNTST